jgi:FkbM family methyltransferase
VQASVSDIKQIWRPIGARLNERLWTLLFASVKNRRTALRRLFDQHMDANALAFVTFDDHALFVDPRDHMIAFRLLSGQSWQREEFETAVATTQAVGALRPGKWFIDVGANIGTQTIYAMRTGQFCGAIAIEPEPHNLELLRRNLAFNGLADQVHVIAAAASSQNAQATLVRDRQNFGAHSLEPNWSATPGTAVTVVTHTIDHILASLNIAPEDVGLVWIDVEGHEIETLRGMQISRAAHVPIVSEISLGSQSPENVEILRAMLTPDYTRVQHLKSPSGRARKVQPNNSQFNQGQLNKAGASNSIAEFEFAARQTDVLIFNADKARVTG